MATDRRRHGRQIRLAEIGEAGQAKLYAASVELDADGFAQTIEERYVRAAGMSVMGSRREKSSEGHDVAKLGLRHGAAREVAEGALLALVKIHAALGSAS